jgi:putative oxidoreductase
MRYWSKWAPLPLRLILGFGFVYHGFPKVSSTSGHERFAGMLQNMGIPEPNIMAWVVGIIEVVGGLALILGALVALASALLIINMLVAMITVHLPHGFSFMNMTGMTDGNPTFGMPGYEVNLLYIAGLLALMLGGAGACALDRQRASRHLEADTAPAQIDGVHRVHT